MCEVHSKELYHEQLVAHTHTHSAKLAVSYHLFGVRIHSKMSGFVRVGEHRHGHRHCTHAGDDARWTPLCCQQNVTNVPFQLTETHEKSGKRSDPGGRSQHCDNLVGRPNSRIVPESIFRVATSSCFCGSDLRSCITAAPWAATYRQPT